MISGAQLQKQARRQETFTTVIRLPGQTLTKNSKSRQLALCSCDPSNPMAKAIWNRQTTQSHLRLWGHAVNAEGHLKRSDLAVRSSGQGNLVSSVVPPLCFYWRFVLCLCLVFLHLLFNSFKPKPLALFFFSLRSSYTCITKHDPIYSPSAPQASAVSYPSNIIPPPNNTPSPVSAVHMDMCVSPFTERWEAY